MPLQQQKAPTIFQSNWRVRLKSWRVSLETSAPHAGKVPTSVTGMSKNIAARVLEKPLAKSEKASISEGKNFFSIIAKLLFLQLAKLFE